MTLHSSNDDGFTKYAISGKTTVPLLIVIMAIVAISVACVTLYALYQAAFQQQRERLIETAQSRARLLEAMLRHEEREVGYPGHGDALTVVLEQLKDSHEQFKGFGETGEFTLATLDNDQMVFLLSHRHFDMDSPRPVSLSSDIAEPMRRALTGNSGTVVEVDYRGEVVLAAHEPVAGGKVGVVAKIDLSEIRAPFLQAGMVASLVGLVFISLGTVLFLRIGGAMAQRLEENEAKYRGLFESAIDMLFLIDVEGIILDVNPAACSTYGYSREELKGRTIASLAHPDYRDRVAAALKHLATRASFHTESVDVRRDGNRLDVEVRFSCLLHKGRQVILSAVRDITERKHTLEVLEQRTRDLGERVKELKCLYGISQLAARPGISLPEMIEGALRLIPPAWQFPEITAARVTVDDQSYRTDNFEDTDWKLARDICVNGDRVGAIDICYLEDRSHAKEGLFLEEELALIEAISERLATYIKSKRTETALNSERDNLRTIYETMKDGVWVSDRKHDMLYVNPALEKEFGCWEGRKCYDYFNGRDSACPECRSGEVFAGKGAHWEWDSCKTGKTYDVIDTPLKNPAGEILQLEICRDVSERKKSEQELKALNETLEQRVAERTAAAERRAVQLRALTADLTQVEQRERRRLADVLHDHLQQLLYGARLQLGRLKTKTLQSRGLQQPVQKIDDVLDESMKALKTLTTELYPPILRADQMSGVLQWLASWMHEHHGLETDVEVDTEADIMPECARVILYQSVRELLFNVVKHGKVAHAQVRMSRLSATRIQVVVSDLGVGFDPNDTKIMETRTGGFGLWSIRERLESFGGQLSIDSAPGRGTRATLLVTTTPTAMAGDETRAVAKQSVGN